MRIRGCTLVRRGSVRVIPGFTGEQGREDEKMRRTTGVRLRLPTEGKREIIRKYARVRERRERMRGSGLSVRERENGSRRGKTRRSEKLKKGQKIDRNFRRLRTCPRVSFPPFKFLHVFPRYHFSPVLELGRPHRSRERILIARSGWPTSRPTMSTRRATSWTRERISRT